MLTAVADKEIVGELDWDFAESQFAESPSYFRPPEQETYGRSLSTIRRLGELMLRKSKADVIRSPEAAQAKVEFYTSVEEGYGTDRNLGSGLEVRAFDERPVLNGKVMSKDLKTSISDMTAAGLRCAEETAQNDRRFLPQLTRSKWDHKNALLVDQMARGETNYNVRIIVSPFPEEAAKQSGNIYWRDIGYVPHLKRGFVQLYLADGTQVITGSLSFDGSDKRRLREVFKEHGVDIPEHEVTDNWLKYAVTGNMSPEAAIRLATDIANKSGDPKFKKSTNTVDVTKQYKPLMERVFNESYIHICESLYRGRQTEGARKLIHQLTNQAKHFNDRYKNALYKMRANTGQFTDNDSVVLHELLVYSTIEMMRALHIEKNTKGGSDMRLRSAYLESIDAAQFQGMLSGFGADGAKNNRVYSACGLSINAGEEGGDNVDDGVQTAFGGNDAKGELSGDKKMMNCPFCGAKVWGDPCARILKCWDCNAMAKDGKVVNSGDGGHRARAERAAAEAAEQAAQRKAKIEKQLAESALHESGEQAKVEPPQNHAAPADNSTEPDPVGVS